MPPDINYDTTSQDQSQIPDSSPSCPPVPTLPAPEVSPFPNPTPNARQPFRGKAVGAATIVAQRGGVTASPVTVASDGSFCIEVDLIPDAPNTVTLIPFSAAGCLGRTTTVQIDHASSPGVDGGQSSIVNVAYNQPVSIDDPDKLEVGSLQNIVDADPQSWIELEFWDPDAGRTCDTAAVLTVNLGKVYTVSRIRLHWAPAAGDYWASCYAVLLSAKESPGAASVQSGDWILATEQTAATEGSQDLTINPESARWAAVLLYENGSDSVTKFYETFRIAELEVWGQDPDAIPPPPIDHCD